jgi:hypothetical protein
MFAPKRVKRRISVQILEQAASEAFRDEKGSGFNAGALIAI